jgi:hypothetical protein
MPDGQVVEMPDQIPPELANRLRAFQAGYKKDPEGFDASKLFRKYVTTPLRESAESVIEPLITLGTGLGSMAIGTGLGVGKEIINGDFGKGTAEKVASDFMAEHTYQPRSAGAQANLATAGKLFQESKIPVSPYTSMSTAAPTLAARLAPAAMRQVGNIAKNEALIAAQALPDVGGKLQSGAQKLMMNALKPTIKQQASGSAEIAARQLLERDLSPNAKGVMAINSRIAELQGEIAASIGDSKAVVSKQAVLDRLISVRDRFMKTANPESDVAAINAAAAGFAEHPLIPGETLPVQLAQDIKQGTYSELRKKYGELGSAQTESQKALARGLKEEIASVEPAVIPLNAEESTLLKTLDVVERRQFLEMNKDPVPLTGALRNPAAWAAITADKSSAFKALLARLMYKTGKAIKGDAPVAVPPAPTTRRIPINQTVYDARNLPQLDTPVIPGSWREGMMSKVETGPGAMDIPVANPLLGMKGVSEGMLSETPTPLPKLPDNFSWSATGRNTDPAMPRQLTAQPFVKSGERYPGAEALKMPTQDFPTRMDLMNTPVMKKAVASFIDEAESIKAAISTEANGFKKSALEARLRGVENRFMAGLKQMGIRNESEARNLMRKVYETGGETQRGIEKVFTPMRAGAQQ